MAFVRRDNLLSDTRLAPVAVLIANENINLGMRAPILGKRDFERSQPGTRTLGNGDAIDSQFPARGRSPDKIAIEIKIGRPRRKVTVRRAVAAHCLDHTNAKFDSRVKQDLVHPNHTNIGVNLSLVMNPRGYENIQGKPNRETNCNFQHGVDFGRGATPRFIRLYSSDFKALLLDFKTLIRLILT